MAEVFKRPIEIAMPQNQQMEENPVRANEFNTKLAIQLNAPMKIQTQEPFNAANMTEITSTLKTWETM